MGLLFGRRRLLVAGGVLALGAGGVALWPAREKHAAYPFARRVLGGKDSLYRASPEALARATHDDAGRLLELVPQLERAVSAIETASAKFAAAEVGALGAEERAELRGLWWQLFEPILAVDTIKARYRGWYGIDYLAERRLHARGFALGFVALAAQVDAGLRLLQIVADRRLFQTLFDEAMPELGLPARTFSGLRGRLGRTRDLFLIPVGAEWYTHWIEGPLADDAELARLKRSLEELAGRAKKRVWTPTSKGVANKVQIVRDELFQRWFPLQKEVAEWAGDTRFTEHARRLIGDAQIAAFKSKLEPCDIVLERRNWYLSNVGLPGFWPHAALYTGTQREILEKLASAPDVIQAYGDLGARFSQRYPKAWASLAERDAANHEKCLVEAVSEGVVSASVEHSCAADYVAALRPRVSPLVRARAIERALRFWSRPYDFNFDFTTDDQLVCSELVLKALEPDRQGDAGLAVPYVEIAGRRAVPPTEFVRDFANRRTSPARALDFVYFLEGREKTRNAVVSDAEALALTVSRPKWDIAQP